MKKSLLLLTALLCLGVGNVVAVDWVGSTIGSSGTYYLLNKNSELFLNKNENVSATPSTLWSFSLSGSTYRINNGSDYVWLDISKNAYSYSGSTAKSSSTPSSEGEGSSSYLSYTTSSTQYQFYYLRTWKHALITCHGYAYLTIDNNSLSTLGASGNNTATTDSKTYWYAISDIEYANHVAINNYEAYYNTYNSSNLPDALWTTVSTYLDKDIYDGYVADLMTSTTLPTTISNVISTLSTYNLSSVKTAYLAALEVLEEAQTNSTANNPKGIADTDIKSAYTALEAATDVAGITAAISGIKSFNSVTFDSEKAAVIYHKDDAIIDAASASVDGSTIIYTTSNNSIIAIVDNVPTFVAVGTATVTATATKDGYYTAKASQEFTAELITPEFTWKIPQSTKGRTYTDFFETNSDGELTITPNQSTTSLATISEGNLVIYNTDGTASFTVSTTQTTKYAAREETFTVDIADAIWTWTPEAISAPGTYYIYNSLYTQEGKFLYTSEEDLNPDGDARYVGVTHTVANATAFDLNSSSEGYLKINGSSNYIHREDGNLTISTESSNFYFGSKSGTAYTIKDGNDDWNWGNRRFLDVESNHETVSFPSLGFVGGGTTESEKSDWWYFISVAQKTKHDDFLSAFSSADSEVEGSSISGRYRNKLFALLDENNSANDANADTKIGYLGAIEDLVDALPAAISVYETGMANLGFGVGQYAPYNGAGYIKAITSFLSNDFHSADVAGLVTTLAGLSSWSANLTEVNAICAGDLTNYIAVGSAGNTTGYDLPYGWSNTGFNTRVLGISESTVEDNPGLVGTTNDRALMVKFSTTYGEEPGYTLPLEANTIYYLSFGYGLWNEAGEIIKDLSVTDPNGATINLTPASVSRNVGNADLCANKVSTAWYDYYGTFTTTDAGDYVLNITNRDGDNQRQMVFYDLVLKTVPLTSSGNMTLSGENINGYWGTFSSTSDVMMPSFVTVYAVTDQSTTTISFSSTPFATFSGVQVGGGSMSGTYIPAGTGVLLFSTSEGYSYYYGNLASPAIDGTNYLHPAAEAMSDDSKLYYKLAYGDSGNKTGLGFYWGADEGAAFTMKKSNTAYLAIPKPAANGAASRFFVFDAIDTATALENLGANTQTIIDWAQPVYNVLGMRVNKGATGVLLQNGNKYYVY